LAFIEGRDFVTPDDVKELAFSALEQRIRLQAEAEMEDVQHRTVIQRALEGVPIPRGKHGPE
jgi:MoxR-like ATPase